MADPSAYDIIQDNQISALQDIVTPYYTPPEAGERSFPVVGQGIDSEQYRLMSLAQGDGIIVTGNGTNSHLLTGLPGGAAETNSQNQMILQVAQNTGRGEAILGGYYHVFYEDMRLNFPPVTTPTTYHVCITRDPRNENQNNHLFVDVYAGTPPTANNRTHIILHTVHRSPNQLLTDATRRTFRQIVSPAITVSTPGQLPDSTTVAHQTLGIVRNQAFGGAVAEGTGGMYEARGISGWQNLLVGPWRDLTVYGGWTSSRARWRFRAGGIDVHFRGNKSASSDNRNRPCTIPGVTLAETFRGPSFYSTQPTKTGQTIEVTQSGDVRFSHGYEQTGGWVDFSFFIPDYFVTN